jgi:hypothetical protein
VDNGTCEYPISGYDCEGICILDADADGVCDADEVPGCTDMDACNFNNGATDDDGSCVYAQSHLDCDGNCLNDTDADGVCDELEISGCTNPDACNYNPDATDEAACILFPVLSSIIGPEQVLLNEVHPFSVNAISGVNYTWSTDPAGANCSLPCDGNGVTLSFPSTGSYIISVVAMLGTDALCADTASLSVNVGPLQLLNLNPTELRIYPNPTTGLTIVELPSVSAGATMTLHDATGRLIGNYFLSKRTTQLDWSDLTAGVYWIRLSLGDLEHPQTLRLVKQ